MRDLLFAGILTSFLAFGALTKLYVDERTDYKQGASFGNAGPIERITANAYSADGGPPVLVEVLKPREPTKGNGTLLYIIGKGPDEKSLLEAGFVILRSKEHNPKRIRDVVGFLRHGEPGILLLSDMRRFVKRAVAFASGPDAGKLSEFAALSLDEKSRKVFDVLWLHESDQRISAVPNGAEVRMTKGKSLEALALELHNQMSPASPPK